MRLARLRKGRCPSCKGRLSSQTWAEQPIVRHAGYGAARRTTVDVCAGCGWSVTREVSEERPG